MGFLGNFFGSKANKKERTTPALPVPSSLEINAFITAASHGNVQPVIALLRKYNTAIIDRKSDPLGRTALMYAAAAGHGNIVNLLLEMRASTVKKDYYGQTALSLARENNHPEVIAQLQQWQSQHKPAVKSTALLNPAM